MSDTHTSDPVDVAFSASPGEQLKRERETQGLSVGEVASALNLRPAVIRGLEDDSYAEVPVAAYRRGYLRSYAHLLGIDDAPVLEAYRTRFGSQDAERKVTPVHVTRPPSRLGAWLFRLVTLLVIAGLIGLTLMWWQSRGGNEPPDIGDNSPVSVDSLDGTTTITAGDEPTADPAADALPPLPDEQSELGLVEDPEATGEPALPEVDPEGSR
ncbi:MAG: helix-turn-helix domain-containing protein, partial [Halomonas sp.]